MEQLSTITRPRQRWWRRAAWCALTTLLVAVAGLSWWLIQRYSVATEMWIALREYSNAEYPEDPADRSPAYGRYHGRRLKLVRRDATHMDFVLEPSDADTARVVFKNIDVSLMTPSEPEWTKSDAGLERIALT